MPAGTTRRWIAALVSSRMLRTPAKEAEPSRVELDLTDAATRALEELFDGLPPG